MGQISCLTYLQIKIIIGVIMRKLRTIENTSPGEKRAFKNKMRVGERYTIEAVKSALNTIQEIINTSLKDLTDLSDEQQYSLQDKLYDTIWIEPSTNGILLESEVLKILEPIASKLQHLYEGYLFTTVDSYTPIVNIHNNKPLDPRLNHKCILQQLEILNNLIERAHDETKHI